MQQNYCGESTMKSTYTDRNKIFLKLIIAARKQVGLTQQELAVRLKKPKSYVSKYELGERRLDIIEFLDIATTLDIDSCSILRKIISPSSSGNNKGGR